jgi:hypothetical protein
VRQRASFFYIAIYYETPGGVENVDFSIKTVMAV